MRSALLSLNGGLFLFAAAMLAASPAAASDRSAAHKPNRVAEAVAHTISVEEDARIFTVFALLNAAGYNDENASTGMHPVRVQVRNALAHQLTPSFAAELKQFYSDHPKATPFDYAVVAMATDGPPDFRPTSEWTSELANVPEFASLAGLHALLPRFYVEARIPILYAEVRPSYVAYIGAYDTAVRKETTAVLSYLRVGPNTRLAGGAGEHKGARVIPNLLESYEKAFSFVLDDRFISVEGPQHTIGYNPHEFVHSVTNPLSYDRRYGGMQQKAKGLLAVGRSKLGDLPSTRALDAFFDENLVRAISIRYLRTGDAERNKKLDAEMMEEWRSGWILERYFYDELGRFERTHMSLAEWYRGALQQLDPARELARWQTAQSER